MSDLGTCYECNTALSPFCPKCNGPSESGEPYRWTIRPDDVDWSYTRSKTGEAVTKFENDAALAHLLLNEVIFAGSGPEGNVELFVVENDVFAWGYSGYHDLPMKEVENLYRMWRKDPAEGANLWCVLQDRHMPQRPVEAAIRKAGIWDLDALKAEHGLRANHYDGVSRVLAQRKYDAYCAWERERGSEPRPFDAGWWAGWTEYQAAHPGWNDDAWKAADDAACREWRVANGHEEATPSPMPEDGGEEDPSKIERRAGT